ncbi:MAG: DEAD/DEAH box helicase [Synergistes sp.]|nr:DEAD/DEAH box helicase [Synergistes sp.]
MLYEWQEKALREIAGDNAMLSAPTGSGKTWVAYIWAGLTDRDGNTLFPSGRIIFTAPIKALSNERYLELKSMGFNVGIETGDFKKNENAPVLCCTQEIYTLKYAAQSGQRVIIDEFHYIFSDSERARAYIDGLRRTSEDSLILVMSATFGSPEKVHTYIEEMARRRFILCETDKRATKLVYKQTGIRFCQIHDALIFSFSKKGVEWTAAQTARTRPMIASDAEKRLREIAFILEVNKIPETMLHGVGMYFGSMLPKEKLLVETAFRERIIDVVAGTDALALGVNLPAETVVFAQMAKFIDGPLTKNEFMQMSGRAGRRGYFETGYVTYIPRSKCENFDYDTALLYLEILNKPKEEAKIRLLPAIARLLRKEADVDTEAAMIAECSMPRRSLRSVKREVEKALHDITQMLAAIESSSERRKVKKILGDIWSDEMERVTNIEIARLFAEYEMPDALECAQIIKKTERNYLQALLKVKRFANRLPEEYRFAGMEKIDAEVNKIDTSVFGFEDKIEKIKITENTEYSADEKNDVPINAKEKTLTLRFSKVKKNTKKRDNRR